MIFSALSKYFKKNPKRIFVIDACGAVVSATSLGIIMPLFQDSFGMPLPILQILALVAVVFAIYSFSCYFISVQNWKLFLKIIMIANALYCLLTAGLAGFFYPFLTLLGIIYFVLEILVICFVIWVEKRVLHLKAGN